MVNIRIATARIAQGRDARLLKLGRRTAPPGVPDGHEDSESIGRHRVDDIGRINGNVDRRRGDNSEMPSSERGSVAPELL